MATNKKPKFWLTALKLAVGACALAGLVWLLLWYADNVKESQPLTVPQKPKLDWGIANDSPIRNNR